MMNIEVHLLSQSQPMRYDDVKNAYTKDGMYCMLLDNGDVIKFPMVNIFRVKEFEDDMVDIVNKYQTEDDFILEGDKTLSNINMLLVPREIFLEALELNKIEITDDISNMNCLSNGSKYLIRIG